MWPALEPEKEFPQEVYAILPRNLKAWIDEHERRLPSEVTMLPPQGVVVIGYDGREQRFKYDPSWFLALWNLME